MRFLLLISSIVFSIHVTFPACGQSGSSPSHRDWFLLDPESSQVQGVSAEKAHSNLLNGRPSKTIIVAIIDSGIDIDHEDLKRVIWTNPNEVPGNGIDDDKNGYTDDIHGWNFIGGMNREVNEDTYELTREYMRLEKQFGTIGENKISKKQKKDYADYLKIKDKYIRLRDKNHEDYSYYLKMSKNLKMSMDTLKAVLDVQQLTVEAIDSFKSSNPTLSFAKGYTKFMLRNFGEDNSLETIQKELAETVDYFRVIEVGYNTDFDSRQIVGDDYSNPKERFYGNNNVKGPDSKHGTHVAGIVAADRTNDLGIKGIADNVQIMSIRTVPNGDERDKDVGNAIRYAVDNGAKIINMSFGKPFSPEKAVVDEAVAYAEKRGVLLIHASGNESEDNDKVENFPNRRYLNGKEARNWLEVGASSANGDQNFVPNFSNFGKKTVDLFAPGVNVYSTTPDNTYEEQSGTSMAAPVATGVAALLWSYFPDLTVTQVIEILKSSTRKFDGLNVKRPGGGEVQFSELSNTGGLINAYEAILAASKRTGTGIEK